jgi:hypothetical protein
MCCASIRQPRQHPADLHRLPLAAPGCGRDATPVQLIGDALERCCPSRLYALDGRRRKGADREASALPSAALPGGGHRNAARFRQARHVTEMSGNDRRVVSWLGVADPLPAKATPMGARVRSRAPWPCLASPPSKPRGASSAPERWQGRSRPAGAPRAALRSGRGRLRGGHHGASLFPQERANGDNLGQAVSHARPQLMLGVGRAKEDEHENRKHAFGCILSGTFGRNVDITRLGAASRIAEPRRMGGGRCTMSG